MKRVLAIIVLVIVVLGVWWFFFKKDAGNTVLDSKEIAIVANKHSEEFNQKVASVVDAYMEMSNAFVNADTTQAKSNASVFLEAIDNISLQELHKDDSLIIKAVEQQLSELKANASPIAQETDLTQMRKDFSMVSENLYPFLKTIGYEGPKLYWQNCPMAFDEDKEANWLSKSSKVVNPYLGSKHPVYKSSMLNCGETKDSIYAK